MYFQKFYFTKLFSIRQISGKVQEKWPEKLRKIWKETFLRKTSTKLPRGAKIERCYYGCVGNPIPDSQCDPRVFKCELGWREVGYLCNQEP